MQTVSTLIGKLDFRIIGLLAGHAAWPVAEFIPYPFSQFYRFYYSLSVTPADFKVQV